MRPRQTERLPWRRIDGRCVVIHPKRGEVHELDEVASFLWLEADGTKSLDEIAGRLTEEFDVDVHDAASDARELFLSLESLGLVTLR